MICHWFDQSQALGSIQPYQGLHMESFHPTEIHLSEIYFILVLFHIGKPTFTQKKAKQMLLVLQSMKAVIDFEEGQQKVENNKVQKVMKRNAKE